MRARKYGRPRERRARAAAGALAASRLRNQSPGTPARRTYVRRFSPWKRESVGSGGSGRSRAPRIVNGVSDTHARPSCRSRSSRGSTSGRRDDAGTSKWRKRISCQRWCPTTSPGRSFTVEGSWRDDSAGGVATARRRGPSIAGRGARAGAGGAGSSAGGPASGAARTAPAMSVAVASAPGPGIAEAGGGSVEERGGVRLALNLPPRLVLHQLREGPLQLGAELGEPL